jgi:hypothetical protein
LFHSVIAECWPGTPRAASDLDWIAVPSTEFNDAALMGHASTWPTETIDRGRKLEPATIVRSAKTALRHTQAFDSIYHFSVKKAEKRIRIIKVDVSQ